MNKLERFKRTMPQCELAYQMIEKAKEVLEADKQKACIKIEEA
jgi:hypothetical protein